MGFLSGIGDFIGDTIDDFTGKTAERAAKRSAEEIAQSAEEARAEYLRLNQPYLDVGTGAIPGLQSFIDDPSGYSFLEGNPMFGAAVDYTSDRLENRGAAQGRFNSGGMVNELFQNYLAMGDDFVNSGYRRAFEPVRLGQNAAAGTGMASADLITGAGSARGAGMVGAANAGVAGTNNLLSLAGAAAGGFGGFPMPSFGATPPVAPPPISPSIAGMGGWF